jgi:predicted phosphoribosyltransferase
VKDTLLLGLGRHMLPIPRLLWQRMVRAGARKSRAGLRFMTEDHHRIRDYVVLQLARAGVPLAAEMIAEALDLDLARVRTILDELEAHMTFLFRNEQGEVTWAYPVTLEETPHRAHLSTGEDAFSP